MPSLTPLEVLEARGFTDADRRRMATDVDHLPYWQDAFAFADVIDRLVNAYVDLYYPRPEDAERRAPARAPL